MALYGSVKKILQTIFEQTIFKVHHVSTIQIRLL